MEQEFNPGGFDVGQNLHSAEPRSGQSTVYYKPENGPELGVCCGVGSLFTPLLMNSGDAFLTTEQ